MTPEDERAGPPRWVKVTVLVVAALALVVVAVLVIGGHRPRPHGPSDEPGDPTPTSVAEHTPPVHS